MNRNHKRLHFVQCLRMMRSNQMSMRRMLPQMVCKETRLYNPCSLCRSNLHHLLLLMMSHKCIVIMHDAIACIQIHCCGTQIPLRQSDCDESNVLSIDHSPSSSINTRVTSPRIQFINPTHFMETISIHAQPDNNLFNSHSLILFSSTKLTNKPSNFRAHRDVMNIVCNVIVSFVIKLESIGCFEF
eukprot:707920_1